jgi:hypothetical protein
MSKAAIARKANANGIRKSRLENYRDSKPAVD